MGTMFRCWAIGLLCLLPLEALAVVTLDQGRRIGDDTFAGESLIVVGDTTILMVDGIVGTAADPPGGITLFDTSNLLINSGIIAGGIEMHDQSTGTVTALGPVGPSSTLDGFIGGLLNILDDAKFAIAGFGFRIDGVGMSGLIHIVLGRDGNVHTLSWDRLNSDATPDSLRFRLDDTPGSHSFLNVIDLPEPATVLILLVALVLLWASRRSRALWLALLMTGLFPSDEAHAVCSGTPPEPNGSCEMGEECDDGNFAPDDGCDAFCLEEVSFGCTCPAAGASDCDQICPFGGPFEHDFLSGIEDGPHQIGQWSAVINFGFEAVHGTLLHTGKVLLWHGGNTPNDDTQTYLWDPSNPAAMPVPEGQPVPHELLCTGHATLADGKVLIAGGEGGGFADASEKVFVYDPVLHVVTPKLSMHHKRWYPSATTLADGRVVVTSGLTPWPSLPLPAPQTTRQRTVERHEIYDPRTNHWRLLQGAQVPMLGEYPSVYAVTDGTALDVMKSTQLLLNQPEQTSQGNIKAWKLDSSGRWNSFGQPSPVAATGPEGTTGAYAPDHFLKMGTSNDPNKVAIYNASQGAQNLWTATDPPDFIRRRASLVVLPNGKLLAVGGANANSFGPYPSGQAEPECGVLGAEAWNPGPPHTSGAQGWEPWANMATSRIYHSIAILLPDGRVLAAGGDNEDNTPETNPDAEIFSPPYLFNSAGLAPRPEIDTVPAAVRFDSGTFAVTSDEAATDTKVVLMRPGSITHNSDVNQRRVELGVVSVSGTTLTVNAPVYLQHPPGYYMLFLLNGSGVPSLAKWVRLYANRDADTWEDHEDNCPLTANQDQLDSDFDGVGNACPDVCAGDDKDWDNDGDPDGCDNCPLDYNPAQSIANSDSAADSVPDDCDRCGGFNDAIDPDQDGIPSDCDLCPSEDSRGLPDADGDSIRDACDNCPYAQNRWQADRGGIGTNQRDGIPDACQCGDVNGNGSVTSVDGIIIKTAALGLAPFDQNPDCAGLLLQGLNCGNVSHYPLSSPTIFVTERCSVNTGSQCSGIDGIFVNARVLGLPGYNILQTCRAANP